MIILPINTQPARCPYCHNVEKKVEICDNCRYEYPQADFPVYVSGRIPNMEDFNFEETLRKVDLYAEVAYSKLPIPEQSKVYYRLSEWSGWRFYLKAIRHGDWRSIKSHIKDTYFTPNPSIH